MSWAVGGMHACAQTGKACRFRCRHAQQRAQVPAGRCSAHNQQTHPEEPDALASHDQRVPIYYTCRALHHGWLWHCDGGSEGRQQGG